MQYQEEKEEEEEEEADGSLPFSEVLESVRRLVGLRVRHKSPTKLVGKGRCIIHRGLIGERFHASRQSVKGGCSLERGRLVDTALV